MDAVELPLPAAIVTKIMRSSGCGGGGGVTRVELLGNQSERETCSSSFLPEKGVDFLSILIYLVYLRSVHLQIYFLLLSFSIQLVF